MDCNAFLSCMDDPGTLMTRGYAILLVALLVISLTYIGLRKQLAPKLPPGQEGPMEGGLPAAAARRLTFHSPDDTPRNFEQEGYILSAVGATLLYSWVVIFSVGYIYMAIFSFFIYAPEGFLWFKPMPDLLSLIHPLPAGTWTARMGPFLVIFTGNHILWLVLSALWESMRTLFMIPAGTLDEPATHVLIREVLSFDTDRELKDVDAGIFNSLKKSFNSLTGGGEAAQVTLVRVETDLDKTRWLEYTCVRYSFEAGQGRFKPMGLEEYTATEVHEMYEIGGLTQDQADQTRKKCGSNEINVYVPGVIESLVNEYSVFTYVFNSIGTWSYMVYSVWNIGIFWLAMTIASGMYRALGIVRPNQQQIAALAQLKEDCKVLRGGQWLSVKAREIVVRDIVLVKQGAKLPCDGVVVEGSMVVNESMLTGEPMPIQKMPVENSKKAAISKKNIAYAGTECMQSIGPVDGMAIMIAMSVGALTTRGQLVRMVLFPTSVRFKYTDQLPIVYGMIFVYMIGLSCIYLSDLVNLGDWIATYLMLMNTVAMCLSPMLPVSLVMGQSVGSRRLQAKDIQCLQPGRIPIAGKISSMVFDKTGTITKDGMDFDSVIAVESSGFGLPVKIAGGLGEDSKAVAKARQEKIRAEVPLVLRNALAACHTVTTLPDGSLVGNAVECSMVASMGWKIDAATDQISAPDGPEVLTIVKKLDFDHKRMTSGVVLKASDQPGFLVLIKGSYERIEAISEPGTVPLNYQATTEQKAKDGFYVLGIATKTIPECSTQELADMTRDEVEAGLGVCGLLLFRNEMKPDSPEAMAKLKEGNIRSVICTGDNALTGISIGHQCGIVNTKQCLLGELEKDTVVWRDPDDEGVGRVDIHDERFKASELAVTQGAWRHLLVEKKELERIWLRLVVFARMKPEDKINVVKYFQSRDLVVGMSGDGGNDCGGLRAAHAGLALSDAEASMVSPFSTGKNDKSLLSMVELIEEGRACISTNIATFVYFMVYCFTLTSLRTYVTVFGALNFGEFVWLLMDVGINIGFVWTMTLSRPREGLANYRPTATLLGPRTLLGVAVPYITCMVLLPICLRVLEGTDFWEASGGFFEPVDDIKIQPRYWMLRGDNFVSPVALLLLYTTLVNVAYCNTYGGDFRANILTNWSVNIVYAALMVFIFSLAIFDSSKINCIWRVNCDTPSSLAADGSSVAADGTRLPKSWPWSGLAFWSSGGLGSCFMGPQIRTWQDEVDVWQGGLAAKGDLCNTDQTEGCSPPIKDWKPLKEEGDCYPYYLNSTTDAEKVKLSLSGPPNEPPISTTSCVGPNNCWDQNYRMFMCGIIVVCMAVNHLFVKVAVQGFVAKMLRVDKLQKGKDMEMQLLEGSS